MRILQVSASNFLSFDSASIDFPANGLVLVTGWDEDLGRANGAGKSSLFQAIAWCLYGELPRDIKVEEIVRRGQKACSVTVTFDVDGTTYVVTRKRPSGLDLTIGGEKQKGNPKYTQSLIEQIIGLSYDQFLITSYFPQKGDASRFLKQNDAKAKDFLGTILNFNKTEAAYKKLHSELKDTEQLVAMKRGEVMSTEQSIERFKTIIDMPVPPMPSKDDVSKVKSELDLLNLVKVPDTGLIDLEIKRVSDAVEKVRAARYEVAEIDRQIASKNVKKTHMGQSNAHIMECPSCAADLLEHDGKLVQFDEEAAAEIRAQKIAQLEQEMVALEEKKQKLSPMVEKEAAFQKKLDDVKSKRQQARHEYDMAVQRKGHLESQMANFRQQATACQQAKSQKDKIAEQLEEMKASLVTKVADLAKLEKEAMLLAAAKAVMSPTGAIAYSLEGVMAELNDQVGQYLDIFSHNTMTYKITSGDDKAKVTHVVTKEESDVSVGSLSGGEERGLILSVDLGLSEVIAGRSGVNLPSILMLDECFDGLDYVGKEKVIDALREIAKDRCIVVIDHSTEFSALFDRSIKVLKKGKVSRLEVS